MSSNEPAVDTNSDKRRTYLSIVLAGIALIAIAYWVYQRMTHVYTNDARIAADMIDVSSKVSGWIVSIAVSSGQQVAAGDLIVTIDDRAARLRLQELEASLSALIAGYQGQLAELGMVGTQIDGNLQAARSQLDVAEASLTTSDSDLEFRASEWQRAQTLRKKKIIAQHDYESAKALFTKSQQARHAALAKVASASARLVEAQASQSRLIVMEKNLAKLQFERDRLQAELEGQKVDLQDRRIVAPSNGIIDKLFVDRGEYIQPGRRILLMHNPAKIWVSANIKETEVRHLDVGQPVSVSVDAYPSEVFTGTLEKIDHAATSQFALLPSTNPSGNFTKVTQRLTTKIAIEQKQSLLKPGMMVEIAIDIR